MNCMLVIFVICWSVFLVLGFCNVISDWFVILVMFSLGSLVCMCVILVFLYVVFMIMNKWFLWFVIIRLLRMLLFLFVNSVYCWCFLVRLVMLIGMICLNVSVVLGLWMMICFMWLMLNNLVFLCVYWCFFIIFSGYWIGIL